MKTLVLGLGNPLLSDDGVGWHVVREVKARLPHPDRGAVDVEESSRGGIDLMERMVGYDRVVVVDAIRTGSPPGTLHRLGPADVPTQHSASGHDVNLATALALGRRAGAPLPADEEIRLVGVEAADVETFAEACTPVVAAAVPRAAALVLEILGSA